ncbi:MAG TPA: hypothetical protein VL371_22710, partial [Gemmataceae bacterium]|nr:hypothetical protein [Gemmataceae bacterium]
MSAGEQLPDDDTEWRDRVRRVVVCTLVLGILAAAGGVWAYRRLEERRVIQEGAAAALRLKAAGAQAEFDGEKFTKVLYGGRPADDEAFAILNRFTAARAVEAAVARVTNEGLRPLVELRDLESLDLTGAVNIDGRGLAPPRAAPSPQLEAQPDGRRGRGTGTLAGPSRARIPVPVRHSGDRRRAFQAARR